MVKKYALESMVNETMTAVVGMSLTMISVCTIINFGH